LLGDVAVGVGIGLDAFVAAAAHDARRFSTAEG
jgi:hypothetical protein